MASQFGSAVDPALAGRLKQEGGVEFQCSVSGLE